jgi:transposase
MRADSQAHIAWREHRVARTDADLAAGSRARPLGRTTDEMLPSTPGVGPGLARTLVAEVPELGLLHRQASAARLGVAPFNDDRGTLRGQWVVWGGRAQVCAVLYMSTLSAVRHHPVLKACYARLRAAGKAATVALTAGLRKRLTIVNALIHQRTRWQAQTAETA